MAWTLSLGVLEQPEAEAGGDEIGLLAAGLGCTPDVVVVVVHETTPVVVGMALAIGTGAAGVVLPGASADQPE
jgi:hypothetical protein